MISYYYSQTTNGFYTSDVAAALPSDAIPITALTWQSLLTAQSAGQRIQADANGNPIAVAIAADPAEQIKSQITTLEATITPRRVREAILGDNGWLKALDEKIAALTAQLAAFDPR